MSFHRCTAKAKYKKHILNIFNNGLKFWNQTAGKAFTNIRSNWRFNLWYSCEKKSTIVFTHLFPLFKKKINTKNTRICIVMMNPICVLAMHSIAETAVERTNQLMPLSSLRQKKNYGKPQIWMRIACGIFQQKYL